jgi:UPF0042 nucleotide-binding protein
MKQLVCITGLSGSGKTLAANCLEDLGFFCVDNLPVGLIPPFCELIQRGDESIARAALVIDAREGGFLEQFPDIYQGLRERRAPVQLLFFEASDDVLKRRFSESRRPHPLAGPRGTLEHAIAAERAALAPLREMADRIIDTSRFTSHELRTFFASAYGAGVDSGRLNVNVMSFGFKYGLPSEADLVFDVRFLPNPYFVEGLRAQDGTSREVREFLDRIEAKRDFVGRMLGFVDFLVPHYAAEGKAYLTIAVGCTGGRHRSVAIADELGDHLKRQDVTASVHHRDLGRE